MLNPFRKQPIEVVDITNPTKFSIMGKYFIGQTGELSFGSSRNAWGELVNPKDSGVNLFFDIFTITNFSDQSFTGEMYLGAVMPSAGKISTVVTPSNQSFAAPAKPKALLRYEDYTLGSPVKGSNIFIRIVPPDSTLVSDSHKGSIIIGPGSSFVIFLKSPGPKPIKGTIVMTWWEEATDSSNY